MGKGVLKSVQAVNTMVAPKLVGMDPCEQVNFRATYSSFPHGHHVGRLAVRKSRQAVSLPSPCLRK